VPSGTQLTPQAQTNLLGNVVSVPATTSSTPRMNEVDIGGEHLIDRISSQQLLITSVLGIPISHQPTRRFLPADLLTLSSPVKSRETGQ
jgi:hypothetical protein